MASSIANAVIDVPAEKAKDCDPDGLCEFCVIKFAEEHFSTENKLLIVRETGKKPHWHIHGTWIADRKSYKTWHHPDRIGEGRSMTRPVRVAFDKDEMGFQYCCKEQPVQVVKMWNITNDEIEAWHAASDAMRADARHGIKRVCEEAIIHAEGEQWDPDQPVGHQYARPQQIFRYVKSAVYAFQLSEGRNIHPAAVKPYVLTAMWAVKKWHPFILDQ